MFMSWQQYINEIGHYQSKHNNLNTKIPFVFLCQLTLYQKSFTADIM